MDKWCVALASIYYKMVQSF